MERSALLRQKPNRANRRGYRADDEAEECGSGRSCRQAWAKCDPGKYSRGWWLHRSTGALCGRGFLPSHETAAPTLGDLCSADAPSTAEEHDSQRSAEASVRRSDPEPRPAPSARLPVPPKVQWSSSCNESFSFTVAEMEPYCHEVRVPFRSLLALPVPGRGTSAPVARC